MEKRNKIGHKNVKPEGDMEQDEYNYKGLRIQTLAGLHEFIAEKIRNTFKVDGHVLDLGSGTGAMSLRLCEMGFQMTAADIVPENFKLHGRVPFSNVNLNDSFSRSFDKQFDGIVAVEVIEHIENPRRFIRECYKLLNPDGVLIMSTPNIDNPVSKASFVRDGTFMWFLDIDYANLGHITPISQWFLQKCILESGFSLEWLGSFGNPFIYTKKRCKVRLFSKLLYLLSIGNKGLNGEILIVIMRKPNVVH